MKKIQKFLIVCLALIMGLISGIIPVQAQDGTNQENETRNASSLEDIQTIKTRLKDYFLELDTIDDGAKVETILVSQAQSYFDTMDDNGTWSDVDYKARDNAANGRPWSPYLALDRLQGLAIAYHKEGNPLYHNPEVIKKLDKAFAHWQSVKPSSTNWWENDIGVNLRFARIGLFLEEELNANSMSVIINSLNKEGVYQGTGQNNLWYDQNALYRSLLEEDVNQLHKVLEECLEYVLILQEDNVTQEALQVDNSLYFHGIQFYSNGYGLSMFRDMSFWIYMLRDTEFSLDDSVVERMSDYMLDGTKWTIRKDILELYLGYRPYKLDVGFNNYAQEYVEPLKRMMVVDATHSGEYADLIENIEGYKSNNGLEGTNYMWRVGYASSMNDTYGANVKMDSNRIIGGEWRGSWPKGEDYGNLIYWTASGSSTISVDGDEYNTVYPTYDWAHSPGVTSPSVVPKDYSNYGRVKNNNSHTIGLSKGKYGSTSYIMDKASTQAQKSYFFFEDEIVALGSGITSTHSAAVHTTLNQVKSNTVTTPNGEIPLDTNLVETQSSWIHNDKTGYVFYDDTSISISNKVQSESPTLWNETEVENAEPTFKAWINHGSKPKESSYSYIILPGVNANDTSTYAQDIPITILENSKKIQAVTHNEKKITLVNFYEAGQLEYGPNKFVSVDYPVNIMIDESSEETIISLAGTDTDYNVKVTVILEKDNQTQETIFNLYEAPYTGKTLTLQSGDSNKYNASTSSESYPIENAFDKDMNTYWKSMTSDEEWISYSLEGTKLVTKLSIYWNNDFFATKFRVLGSVDGHKYSPITDVIEGTTGSNDIVLYNKINYIKIELLESNTTGYEIKEIVTESFANISKSKPVSVSSTSATDSGNIASNAVDGDNGTRWSSARNTDSEWIYIDFEGKATIYAIELLWESARSANYTLEISNDKKNWTAIQSVQEDAALQDSILLEEAVSGRYLRLRSDKSVLPKYGISIFEFQVFGTVEDIDEEDKVNLALYKPSKSSSNYTNPKTGFVLDSSLAFDGSVVNNGDSYQSRWVSKRESNDEWISVDLEKVYLVEDVILNWEGAHASEYKIQASIDGEHWIDVYTNLQGKAGIEEITLEQPINARYMKMQGIKPATKYGYSLWEFEVYGQEYAKENVALNKETASSSHYTNPKTGFELESKYAVDGSIVNNGDTFQSRWVSKRESNDEWISINLDGLYWIDSVVLNWEGAHASEYKIQISNDNLIWTDIDHITAGKAGIYEFNADEMILTQYIRMQGITPATKYGYSLWEFEVYGIKVQESYVDTTQLNQILNDYLLVDAALYTRKSYEAFSTVYQNALEVAETKETQVIVNQHYNELILAYESLETREDTNLKALLEEALIYQESLYTAESFNELQIEITNTQQLISMGAYINSEYVDQEGSLQAAIDQLELRPILPQQTAQDVANTITQLHLDEAKVILPVIEDYTITIHSSSDTTVVNLDGEFIPQNEDYKVNLILIVVNNENQEDIGYTKEISIIIPKKIVSLDYNQLNKVIELGMTYKDTYYTQGSFHRLVQSIQIAKDLKTLEGVTQEQINEKVKQIQDSIVNLVDMYEIITLYNLNFEEETYTVSSWLHYTTTKSLVSEVIIKYDPTKKEINESYTNLQNSILELVVRAKDYDRINSLIDTIDNLNPNLYTSESYKQFMDYKNEVEKALVSGDLSQEDVDTLYTNLEEAMNSLVKKEVNPEVPSKPEGPTTPISPEQKPSTYTPPSTSYNNSLENSSSLEIKESEESKEEQIRIIENKETNETTQNPTQDSRPNTEDGEVSTNSSTYLYVIGGVSLVTIVAASVAWIIRKK